MNTTPITRKDFIEAGAKPGQWFTDAVACAEELLKSGYMREHAIRESISRCEPAPPLPLRTLGQTNLHINILAESTEEVRNVQNVVETMQEVLRTPVVVAGAVMPMRVPLGR